MELTKEDVQAMRHATSVVIRIDDGKVRVEMAEKVTAHKRGVMLESELRHSVDANGGVSRNAGTRAVFSIGYAALDGNWQALCMLVRPGDDLRFNASDNGNGYLKHAEISPYAWDDEPDAKGHHPHYYRLYNDWLTVTIYRQGKPILRDLYLDHTLCPNNSARAIK